MPLPRLLPGDPKNCLSGSARQRIEDAHHEADKIRQRALTKIAARHQSDPDVQESLASYLDSSQSGIELIEAKEQAALKVLKVIADEFRAAGKSGRELREIMEEEIEGAVNSLELTVFHRSLLLLELDLYKTTPNDVSQSSGVVAESSTDSVFRKHGRVWTISFGGQSIHLPDARGLGYIAELLRHPRAAIEAAQLAGERVEPSKQLALLSGLPMADETAIKAVRADLFTKKTELAGLPDNDWVKRGEIEEEIEKLEKYLGEVKDHCGRPRKVAGTAQRARTAVTNAINRAINEISKQHPSLGKHLKESIKTGTSPIYAPTKAEDWRF